MYIVQPIKFYDDNY